MKKLIAIMLAVVMAFALVAIVACDSEKVVRVTLFVTDNDTIVRKHTVGKDDLPTDFTNGNLEFGGWYYDKAYTKEFDIDNEEDNQIVYAKWNNEKVTLILNYNYTGASLQTETVTKGATYNLPSPTLDGYTFDGWYTLPTGGTKWTNTTPVTDDTTLYAHWTQNGGVTPAPTDLSAVFAKYSDDSKWNFAATVTISYDGETWTDYYEYLAYDILYRYEYDETTYTDYFGYDETDAYCYFSDDGDGAYTKYSESADEFEAYYYLALVDLSAIGSYQFTQSGSGYVAKNPSDAGNAVLGEYDESVWTSLTVTVSNGNISKLVGVMDDGYTVTFTFSKFGAVSFTLPDANGGGSDESDYTITINSSKSTIIEVGATVDFTQYFTITDKDGASITVTESMLDLTKVDTSKTGTFAVTISYEDASKTLTFTVVASGTDITTTPAELAAVFANYTDISSWNFAVTIKGDDLDDYYEYLGYSVLNRYEYDGEQYTDYLGYESNTYYFFYDNGDGTYTKYAEGTDDYEECYYYLYLVELRNIGNYTFIASGDGYVATSPSDAGNYVLGEFESAWASLTVYIANGRITKLVGVMDDGYTMTLTFSKHGTVRFTLPDAEEGGSSGSDIPTEPTGTMENQVYNANDFDKETLQNKLTTTGKYADPYIGLPSKGTYNALVVPIKFSDTTISQEQLNNLNIAFNGTSEQTGWESVKTYYSKASYGALNLSFDIAGFNISGVNYYSSSKKSTYYAGLTATYEGEKYNNGDNVLLHEVLAYYKDKLDLDKYDTNGDGAIDAIYLIYSAPVDYSEDSFYWAYVTWDQEDETKYDGKDVYYYLFAGLDFMKESVKGGYVNKNYPEISGLKVNASTYIHETGHLLGLDDYYDYYPNKGCNEGLGGADMMDNTVGDQNVYSKTMLGWITPQIVTSTKTITIKSSQEKGDAILIPLNWNNSYFCEYLIVDLYSAAGLNELHATMPDTYLYSGAQYGVRIYHVSSWIENAYDNEFGSFTDNNNSVSGLPLIRLIEADGENRFVSSDGCAASSDLWKAGDSLNKVFPQYMRYDGKLINFNITIDSVSAESATVTITYNTTAAAA